MQLKDRIFLTWQYGKGQLLLGGVYNVVCACLMAQDVYYAFFVDAFILKTVLTAITLYLIKQFRDRGIIVTDHNYDALSSVADNLFVIADGYTNPVQFREDLVRHGYLR